MQIRLSLLMFALLMQVGCQKPPSPSVAVEPNAKKAVAPMGSSTNNADLAKKKLLLEALLSGEKESSALLETENKAFLADLYKIFPPETFAKMPLKSGLRKNFIWAEFYFYERRFIESAKLLSEILDQDAKYPEARNLLARCFYFLGNPDRADAELNFVLSHPTANAEELLDALFLIGAIALESPAASKKMLEKGISAWETYLKIAPAHELRKKIETGLKELRQKLKTADSQSTAETSKPKARTTRVAHLDVKAKQWEKLKAQGLDAFDVGDLLLAEKKLVEASLLHRSDPEIETALGRVLIKTNRFQEALSKFQQTTKQHPRYAPAWHYQGMAYMMSANPQKAVESWQKVMELDAKYGDEFSLRDRILVAKGMIR